MYVCMYACMCVCVFKKCLHVLNVTAEEDSGAGVCGAMDMQPVCHQLCPPAGLGHVGRQNAAISTIPPSPASLLSLLHLSFHGGPRQTCQE